MVEGMDVLPGALVLPALGLHDIASWCGCGCTYGACNVCIGLVRG